MADGYLNSRGKMQYSLSGMLKRPRSDYELAGRLSLTNEIFRHREMDDSRGGLLIGRDVETLCSAYERYLQSSKISRSLGEYGSYRRGELRTVAGMPSLQICDPLVVGSSRIASTGKRMLLNGELHGDGMTRPRELVPLPPDASSTLYIEGLPPDCTRREVAHIFRPFVGYKEIRLVKKEAKHRGDSVVLCFVDFTTPECAANSLSALQGYKMDELDSESAYLRLQFSKFPGRKTGGGYHGKQ